PGRPLFVFGHSMGGALVTLYAIERHPQIDGIVLSAPALRTPRSISDVVGAFTRLTGDIASHLAVLELADDAISRDPEVTNDIIHDPYVQHGPGPARTAAEVLRGIDRIQRGMGQLEIPFFVMHGTADRLTDPQGSRQLYEHAHTPDRTICVYDGYFHDLLHEP